MIGLVDLVDKNDMVDAVDVSRHIRHVSFREMYDNCVFIFQISNIACSAVRGAVTVVTNIQLLPQRKRVHYK